METKINIAEILKDKPQGTKLYSRICGAVELKKVINVRKKKSIVVKELNSNNQHRFWHDGNFFRAGQCVLQPSENMADWSKFSWKKGDVLQNNDHNTQVIFDRFISDTYEMVRCKYWLKVDNGIERFVVETNVFTKDYFKVSEELSQCYINEIENRCGGKLNLETLEIEKQTEFKDGDIVFVGSYMLGINTSSMIAIFRKDKEIDKYKFSPALCESNEHDTYLREAPVVLSPSEIMIFRPANDSEKHQLFDALAKEGKRWDSDKKSIVDLKPKVELKPFDKVLVRDFESQAWQVSLFSYKDSDSYYCCNGCSWNQCIPYIGNESLLGTTKDVEVSYGRSF